MVAVSYVGRVGDLTFLVVHVVLNHADRHAEEPVQATHPFRVAACEVVVDGDDVDAFAFERIEVGGQRRDERLAFAGLHFRDLAAVQHHAADELDVEVPHVQHATASLPHHGECVRNQIVERLTVGEARAELGSLPAKFLIGESFDFRFLRVDGGDVGRSRFRSRSFCVPMTFARRVSTIIRDESGQGIAQL